MSLALAGRTVLLYKARSFRERPMAYGNETARVPARARGAWSVLRAAVAGEEHDYTQGSIGRALLLLAIPMMLEMAMESVFAIVDIFFVALAQWLELGPDGVFAAAAIAESVLAVLAWWVFRRGHWKLKVV